MARALLEHEAKQLLRDHGLPVQDFLFCPTVDEAVEAAQKIGYPVVLKIVSPQIVHKSDAGGVKLNLKNEAEVRSAYEEVMASARRYDPQAEIKGVLVCPFAGREEELIVGAINDSQFGPVVMVGLGGIFVEVFKDVSFGIAPVTLAEAQEMLESLTAYPIIKGTRGRAGLNMEMLKELIVGVSEFICKYPVQELDLNPVFCSKDSVSVVDARILLRE